MHVVAELWPAEPGVGSPLASDAARASVSTYAVARILLLDAMLQLRAAAATFKDERLAARGTHLLLLRPALVSSLKERGRSRAWRFAPVRFLLVPGCLGVGAIVRCRGQGSAAGRPRSGRRSLTPTPTGARSWWRDGTRRSGLAPRGVSGVAVFVSMVPTAVPEGRPRLGCRSSLRPAWWGHGAVRPRSGGVNQAGDLAGVRGS
jgi:hypothetical protein